MNGSPPAPGTEYEQESFAHESVSPCDGEPLENGRTTPNKVAQKVLLLLERKLHKMKNS